MNTTGNYNVSLVLERLAKEQTSRAALIYVAHGGTRVASFGDLHDEVRDAARILRQAGVKSLDVVLIYVPLQRELISLLLAVFRIGAQALFIDPSYGPLKVLHCLRLAKPKFAIVDKRLRPLAVVAPMFGIKGVLTFESIKRGGIKGGLEIINAMEIDTLAIASPDIAVVPANHPALITFTSGSTGKPKGIVRSHGFLAHQEQLLQKSLPPIQSTLSNQATQTSQAPQSCSDGLNVMTTLPMFILAALAAGQTSIIPASNPDKLLQQLKYLGLDRLLCSPHNLQNICNLVTDANIKLPELKQVVVGGGPVFPGLLAQIADLMPGAAVTTVYGSTEAEPICHQQLKPIKLIKHRRGLPLGRPINEITLHIIDPRALGQRSRLSCQQLRAITQQAHREGEIVVSGDHVVRGYLGGVGDSETKIEVDGRIFHRTGDAGYLTDQGELFLTGRVAYGVANGADTVYPLAVELLAMDNEAIERCAFVAVSGKSVLALKLKDSRAKELVLGQLKQAFAKANVAIDKYVVVNTLPLDERHQSKIVYGKLKRQLRFAS